MSKENKQRNFENVHWADNSAQRVIDTFPNEKIYTVASGITPSGIVHVGHFREIITSEFVRRGLEKKGKKTKFIYSWDSYDAFRKVPKNIPKEWEQYLRLPDAEVPDPQECHENFAEHFMQTTEENLKVFNFPIEFQRQHKLQTSGIYAKSIREVLRNKQKVIDALNKYREVPLADEWMPIDVYDDETKKDNNVVLSYDGEYTLEYKNSEGKIKIVNFKEDPRVKLRWKADWPMRWNYYKVDFEPGGKDHSTPGSSYTTGCEIVREIFGREPPVYTAYNFVRMKGQGGKVSSSSGNGATVSDVLDIYTPEMVLYIFAGTRPNAEFDISFDLDVIKIYEDFDKLERLYFGLEEEKNEKKLETAKRIYELSMVNGVKIPKKIPFQPSFRHLLNVAQANDFNFDKVKSFYENEVKTKFDENRLKERMECARNWLKDYAPEDMKFHFKDKIENNFVNTLSKEQINALKEVSKQLEMKTDAKELMGEFKLICEKNSILPKDLFQAAYGLIIGKEKGPRLAGLMIENKEKVLKLLKQL